MTLTTTLIEKARYGGKSYLGKTGKKAWSKHVIQDDVVAGLGLRVFPGGRKTFVLSYRKQGKRRTKTLGEFGPLTLAAAREQATKFLEAVGDPLSPPTAAGATTATGKLVTVADLTQACTSSEYSGHTGSISKRRFIDSI